MNKLKKVCAIMMSVILVMSMTACADNKEKVSNREGDTIYVTAFLGGFGKEWLEAVADKYTEETGTVVDINWDNNLMSTMKDKFDVNLNMDDLYYINLSNEQTPLIWYKQGKLESLNDVFSEKDENGKTLQDKLTKKECGTLNGERFYAPMSQSSDCLVYNMDILERVGWDHIPDTVDEMIAYFEDVLKANLKAEDGNAIKPLVWTGYYSGISHIYDAICAQYGGVENWNEYYNWSDESGPSYELYHQESMVKALEATKSLLKPNANGVSEYSLEGSLGFTNVDAQRAFASGYAAVCITGTWYKSEMGDVAENIEYKLSPFPLYRDEQGSYGSQMEKVDVNGPDEPSNYKKYRVESYYNDCMVVPSAARNKEGAKDFLRYILKEENMQLMHEKCDNAFCYEYDNSSLPLSEWGEDVRDYINNTVLVTKGANNLLYFAGCLGQDRNGMWNSIATDVGYNIRKEVIDWKWQDVSQNWEERVQQSKSLK